MRRDLDRELDKRTETSRRKDFGKQNLYDG
jgi:hypothetical protein